MRQHWFHHVAFISSLDKKVGEVWITVDEEVQAVRGGMLVEPLWRWEKTSVKDFRVAHWTRQRRLSDQVV
jgi:hypothetical protein